MGGVYLRKYQLVGLECNFHVNCFQRELLLSVWQLCYTVCMTHCYRWIPCHALRLFFFEGCGINSLTVRLTTYSGTKCSSTILSFTEKLCSFHKVESTFYPTKCTSLFRANV